MADIDPRLSPHLCSAMTSVLSADFQEPLVCVDVSGQQLAWDLEARDPADGLVLRISHTLAPWGHFRKAAAEVNDVRATLERELAGAALKDVVVSLILHEPPTSSTERRQFAASLVDYIRNAVATLRDASFGTELDIRKLADLAGDPRTVELHTTLCEFRVVKISLEGVAIIDVADTRFFGWQPSVASTALPRLEAKSQRHGSQAPQLVLLIEVEDADMSPPSIQDLRQQIGSEHPRFQALYLCNRDHSLSYRVVRVY